ncbi:hypothetical protein ABIA06_002998 [Bradyrhizobium yuanmingense]|uniref:hypothetical protein n=1 Tax=Bradyrhizobium yuanmingense TaxID=108015 RepID=UPI0035173988
MFEVATVKRVEDAIAVAGRYETKVTRRPLVGGMLKFNWLVHHAGTEYFVGRSDSFVDRKLAKAAASKANNSDHAPAEFFSIERGAEVIELLQGYRASTNADFSRKEFPCSAIDLHLNFSACERLSVTKDVFALTDEDIEQSEALGAIRPASSGCSVSIRVQKQLSFLPASICRLSRCWSISSQKVRAEPNHGHKNDRF